VNHKESSFISDQRGAVALEMPIVWLFMTLTLLLPLADLAIAGFQYISAWQALRAFGQYVQYHSPPDVTNTSSWTSTLPTSVAGYLISNVQVLCGNTDAGAACSSSNVTLPIKYYSYTTTVTLAPMVLRSVLCTSGNANHCSFTLPYSERFQ
jgi:Flp pilus assembly protein TadG